MLQGDYTEKSIAILQSNYIPWKGYFDLIARVDEFILYDDVQYTKNDWRNRNQIKSAQGVQWLTIPISGAGKFGQAIKDTQIADAEWAEKHWKTVRHNYSKAPFYRWCKDWLEPLYKAAARERMLSQVNRMYIDAICGKLGITTRISWSMDYSIDGGKSERLISLCGQASATEYVSGPAAKCYLDDTLFLKDGVTVSWMDYSGYNEYPQLYQPFTHYVSILDLLFMVGPEAGGYMKYVIKRQM